MRPFVHYVWFLAMVTLTLQSQKCDDIDHQSGRVDKITIGFVESFTTVIANCRHHGILDQNHPFASPKKHQRRLFSRNTVVEEFNIEDQWNATSSSPSLTTSNTNSQTSETNSVGSYRRIEDWHEEHHDPNHVIEHLKREQARWRKTFEDLGGDGI
jgi:hypothetical protein